ncbi:hypothetical protein LIER_13275 [Lithospermum erythrorhizon]|uniref:GTD-binding domain-containing protein n=1 Tax=Lithospermum erythrorhizon TaxID=34254 RepID=A0AAV3PWU7_LITER
MADHDDDVMGFFAKEQPEMASLKETLRDQQNLLHKLYKELEAERESSSTAASEALAMILRLQEEKAAVKMEAEQYKRLIEEKMCHAEESLSMFEELIYQKEMEVASLDYQVQAYRYKLMSIGCTDLGIGEIKSLENLLQRNEDVTSSQNLGTPVRRNSGTPRMFKLLNQKKGLNEREGSTNPKWELEEKEWSDQGSDTELLTANSSMTDINSYFEQIRRLDERVKEVAGVHLNRATSSPLPLSWLSSGNSSDPIRIVGMNETDNAQSRRNSSDNDSTDTPGVLDVFEVPQVDQDEKSQGKTVAFAADDLIKRLDSIPDDALKPEVKNDIKWLNNLLESARVKIMSSPRATALDCNKAIASPTARVAVGPQNSIRQIRTSEIIEVGNHSSREESGGKGEELNLLSDIKEQLNTIQSQIINLKNNHSVSKQKKAIVSYMETTLMEEMVQFWL